MFQTIPHGTFPFDESPWIKHFRDADDANQRAQIHAASSADTSGHDAFAQYIMGAKPGENPFATYRGPFFEGSRKQEHTPDLPNQLYAEYFPDYRMPGSYPVGQGPFADPRKNKINGAAGTEVTGDAYRIRNGYYGAAPWAGPSGGLLDKLGNLSNP